jgi:hypothetical protein
MIARYTIYILVLFLTSMTATAQKAILKGYLRDSITHYPIINGTITNWNTQQKAKTNEKGFFYLEVSTNDQLYVQAPEYHYDTLNYTPFFTDTVTLFLSPSGSILPGVTVRSSYTKYQLDSIRRKEDFDTMRGTVIRAIGPPPTTGFGLNINLDRFYKKRYRQKARAGEMFQRTEERMYVDYRFSPQMVAYYTGLKGDALRLFMFQYTPSYQWLRQHPSQQDVLLYINDKLKLFKASQASNKNQSL